MQYFINSFTLNDEGENFYRKKMKHWKNHSQQISFVDGDGHEKKRIKPETRKSYSMKKKNKSSFRRKTRIERSIPSYNKGFHEWSKTYTILF